MSRTKSLTILIILIMFAPMIQYRTNSRPINPKFTGSSDSLASDRLSLDRLGSDRVVNDRLGIDKRATAEIGAPSKVPKLKESGKIMLQFDSKESRDNSVAYLRENGWNILHVFSLLPMITVLDQPYSLDELHNLGVTKVIPSYIATSQQQSNLKSLRTEVEGMTLEDTALQININKLWDMGLTGTGQTWTIVDSGVDDSLKSFADLENISRSRVHGFAIQSLLNDPSEGTKDKSGHGTHVAGIAAGNGYFRNRKGVLELFKSHGMAQDVEINAIKVLDKNGYGDTASVLEGLEMAIQMNSSIISMSFGTQLYEGIEDPHIELINEAKKRDILMVAAVGNDGWFGGSTIGLPAALPDVLAVGAVKDRFYANDPYFIPWDGSSRSPSIPGSYSLKPDVLAPGVNIISVNVTTDEPNKRSGTSMAVPHVSGGAVLLRQAFPNATAAEVRYAIMAGAKDIYASAEVQGRGMVDFYKAYQILNGSLETSGLQKTVVTPVAFNDGTDRSVTGRSPRSENLFYTQSIVGQTKTFNMTLFSKENLTLLPKVQYFFGSAQITLPTSVDVKEGVNYIPVTLGLNSTTIEYNFAEIYFVDSSTGEMMEFSNVTYFSMSKFSRGTVLFDLSKDADTKTGYFANDGPRGKYMKLASLLENQGFVVRENRETLTADLLKDIQVLVIADPELDYGADERTLIRKFVADEGKGLLMIGNGGFVAAEGESFGPFNYVTMNNILTFGGDLKSGIQFDLEVNVDSTNPADFRLVPGGKVVRTRNDQSVLPRGASFEFYGPKLKLDFQHSTLVADYSGVPIVAASEVGKGRIMVFASNLGFDSLALQLGRYKDSDTTDAQNVAIGTFNWLIAPNEPKVTFDVSGISYNRLETININLYDTVRIVLEAPKLPDGTIVASHGDTVDGYIYYKPSAWGDKRIEFVNNPSNPEEYYADVAFNDYGDYQLIIKMDSGIGVIYSKIDLSVNLQFFNDQEIFNLTARIIFIALVASWIIWLRNEGGRKLRKYQIAQRKKKKK